MIATRTVCSVSGFLLAMCAAAAALGADKVKDIQADKFGYLKSNFSTAVIGKPVLEAINKADSAKVNFKKLVFTEIPHVVSTQSTAVPPDYRNIVTFISVGGPFVNVLDEMYSNGFATSQSYAMTYRGILYLESQYVLLSAVAAPPTSTLKNLKQFSAIDMSAATGGEFSWRYQIAPRIQLFNFKDTSFHCTYGKTYPASGINAKLQGDAQDLECEIRNDNDVVTGHSVATLLRQYGIGLVRSKTTPNSTVTFAIDDVQID